MEPGELNLALPAHSKLVGEWLSLPKEQGAELINGRIVYRAMPYVQHGNAQGNVFAQLAGAQFPLDDHPGWWLSLEVDLLIGGQGMRPDLAGWRRDRHPDPPDPVLIGGKKVIATPPDWVCEVLSPSTADQDLGPKREAYYRAQVGHYWVVDMENEVLTIFRWTQVGYAFLTAAGKSEIIKPEPFESIDFKVSWLFLSNKSRAQLELTYSK